ncbi:MAG: ArsR family transcriptional regulator [Bdellovibrionales bacterium]|nr:ArsR family transcriptional regulator [Bdellovibrionales bacterium]
MKNIIDQKLFEEIPVFENFLARIGFKRIDGSVYGALVLSPRPLTSEEIGQELKISQSAVSNSLKTLSHYGAIQTTYDRQKRANVHKAKLDSLEVAATVFKKREQEVISEFKSMASRIKNHLENKPSDSRGQQIILKRIDSILATCSIAESVMNFVISLAQMEVSSKVEVVVNKLPKVFSTLTHSAETVEGLSQTFKSFMAQGLKNLKNTKDNHYEA